MAFDLVTARPTLTMTSREIAELTDKRHDNVLRDTRVMIERFEQSADSNLRWHCETEHYIDEQGKAREMYRLDKNTTLCLVAGYDPVPRMRIIQRLEALESGAVPAPALDTALDRKLKIARVAADILRLSETSKVRMLTALAAEEHTDVKFLPAYVDEGLTRALTSLLKEHGSLISAKVANLALLDMDLLETLERPSSHGQTKHFKSLTPQGLAYGRNETSPQNPRETQPLYYVARFAELLRLIETHLASDNLAA